MPALQHLAEQRQGICRRYNATALLGFATGLGARFEAGGAMAVARCLDLRGFAFGADAGEEFGCGLVGAAFAAGQFGFGGDEFASEGFCEDGLREFIGTNSSGGNAPFNCVGQFEQGLDAPNHFFLMGLLSAMDAVLDMRMVEILEEIAVEQDIKGALVGRGIAFATFLKRFLRLTW